MTYHEDLKSSLTALPKGLKKSYQFPYQVPLAPSYPSYPSYPSEYIKEKGRPEKVYLCCPK